MAQIVFYSSSITSTLKISQDISKCEFLLKALKVQYETVDLAQNPERREAMKAVSGKAILPQVFVNGKYIGGADELQQMADDGELAAVLAGKQ